MRTPAETRRPAGVWRGLLTYLLPLEDGVSETHSQARVDLQGRLLGRSPPPCYRLERPGASALQQQQWKPAWRPAGFFRWVRPKEVIDKGTDTLHADGRKAAASEEKLSPETSGAYPQSLQYKDPRQRGHWESTHSQIILLLLAAKLRTCPYHLSLCRRSGMLGDSRKDLPPASPESRGLLAQASHWARSGCIKVWRTSLGFL
ncbi:uncharacterized protein LOC122444000 [Cervus canadensis]|uniref:uncharacterized protein LOC122444000 n=1 Tax=Cervus canadensis TaxID=1574408 RepID=UPI001C9E8550|nr:uncharacterized protein LOC122444000 [Cervus canadensis]